jgi:hypothetical protein
VANAAAQGVAATPTPSVGSVAVWPAGAGYDARYGHVAVVTAATPTSYTVSEMNYLGEGVVDARTIPWPDPRVWGSCRDPRLPPQPRLAHLRHWRAAPGRRPVPAGGGAAGAPAGRPLAAA